MFLLSSAEWKVPLFRGGVSRWLPLTGYNGRWRAMFSGITTASDSIIVCRWVSYGYGRPLVGVGQDFSPL